MREGLDFWASVQIPGVGADETAVGAMEALSGLFPGPVGEKPGRNSVDIVNPLSRFVQGHGVRQDGIGLARVQSWGDQTVPERPLEGPPLANLEGPGRSRVQAS